MPAESAEQFFDLSGIGIRVAGLSPMLADALDRGWGDYRSTTIETPLLDCRIELEPGELSGTTFDPKRMRASYATGGASFSIVEGTAEIDRDHVARVKLIDDGGKRTYYALLNLLRACLAWSLPDRDALMVHAAGAVIDRRAFVLVGAAGSGKSTWSGLVAEAGGQPISEDLVLLQRVGQRVLVLGAPFRVPRGLPPQRGRFPLAALLMPEHGAPARLDPVAPLLLRTRLVANLPFLVEAIESDERPTAQVEKLATAAPAYRLTFPPDTSFIELLRGI